MTDYILYNERGVLDPDEASILEAFDAENDEAAYNEAVSTWAQCGWALWRMKQTAEKDVLEDDVLIAWSSPTGKGVKRWAAWFDAPRYYRRNSRRERSNVDV